MKEGGCYRGGAGIGERDGFGPAGEAIDDCEKMAVTCRRWKRAQEVDVDVLEAFFQGFEPLEGSLHMDSDLVVLAVGACAGPSDYIGWG